MAGKETDSVVISDLEKNTTHTINSLNNTITKINRGLDIASKGIFFPNLPTRELTYREKYSFDHLKRYTPDTTKFNRGIVETINFSEDVKDTYDSLKFGRDLALKKAPASAFVDEAKKAIKNYAENTKDETAEMVSFGIDFFEDLTVTEKGLKSFPKNYFRAEALKGELNATSLQRQTIDNVKVFSAVPGLNTIGEKMFEVFEEDAEKINYILSKSEDYERYASGNTNTSLSTSGKSVFEQAQEDLTILKGLTDNGNELASVYEKKIKQLDPSNNLRVAMAMDDFLVRYEKILNSNLPPEKKQTEVNDLNYGLKTYLKAQQPFVTANITGEEYDKRMPFSYQQANSTPTELWTLPLIQEDIYSSMQENNKNGLEQIYREDLTSVGTLLGAYLETINNVKDALVYEGGFQGNASEFQSQFPRMPEEEKQKYTDLFGTLRDIDNLFNDMQGDVIDRYINNHVRTYKETVYSSPSEKLQKNQQKNSEFSNWLPGYANGDIVHGPTHALIGEAGPEAIIPLSAARRGRGLSLWQKAGQMMGVGMFADGGIVGDISQAGTGGAFSISLGGVNISVSADGGDSGNIVAAIKSALPEVTNTIAAELAQMLSKTFQNMPNRVEGVA